MDSKECYINILTKIITHYSADMKIIIYSIIGIVGKLNVLYVHVGT